MIRLFALLCVIAMPLKAQDFSGLARVNNAKSQMIETADGVQLDLHLTQIVPYGVYTLDTPNRVILEFREVDWTGLEPDFDQAGGISAQHGAFRPGTSRMVLTLDEPMIVKSAGTSFDEDSGAAHLQLVLAPVTQDAFTANINPPPAQDWGHLITSLPAPVRDDGPLVVVIDPGHGGIDPGAERDGQNEADLMLRLSIEVAEALNRSAGVRAILTREADIFVPLGQRMTIARAAGADLFISLHADALEEDEARGASVYTLNAEGADKAAERMAERHERGDLLAGLDLTGTDDRVATVLMDMARAESGPKGDRFADTLVSAMRNTGQRLNSRPRREGRLAVLNAADFPSVLIEVGFLSNTADREALRSKAGRAPIVASIRDAVQRWAVDETTRDALIRQ